MRQTLEDVPGPLECLQAVQLLDNFLGLDRTDHRGGGGRGRRFARGDGVAGQQRTGAALVQFLPILLLESRGPGHAGFMPCVDPRMRAGQLSRSLQRRRACD